MQIDFAPRKQLSDWLRDGWRLVPRHNYNPGDYAIMVQRSDDPEPISEQAIRVTAARFLPKPTGFNNRSAGASSRQGALYSKILRRRLAAHEVA